MDKKILFFIVAPEKVEFNVFLPPTILNRKKEIFHPQVPLRMPCYDLALVTELTLRPRKRGMSGAPGFSGLTGGEYKA